MPIVFAAPDAVGQFAGDFASAGYVDQLNKQQQFQLQASSIASQAHSAANAANVAAGQGNANRSTQAAIAGSQEQVSGRDIFAAQQQSQQQQAAMQHADAMQANQFNYADNLQLQRMQQAMSAVDNDPDLSPEDKANYKLQLQTGIDPLMKRQQAAKAQQYQEQTQQAAEEAETRAVNAKTFQAFVAAGKPPIQQVPGGILAYQPDGKVQYHAIKEEPETDDVDEARGVSAPAGKGRSSAGSSKSSGASAGIDFSKIYNESKEMFTNNNTGVYNEAAHLKHIETAADALQGLEDRRRARVALSDAADYADTMNKMYPQGLDKAKAAGQITPIQEAKYRRAMALINSTKAMPKKTVPGDPDAGTAPAGVSTDTKGNAARGDEPWLNGQVMYQARDGKKWIKGNDDKLYMQDKDGKVYIVPPGTAYGEATEGPTLNMQGFRDAGNWVGDRLKGISLSPRGPGVP